jgi:hypothetical protein
MKKITLLLLLTITISFSQTKKTKKLLAQIEGKWKLDDNNNITYIKIIEDLDLKKDEIYTRALEYFTYNYGSGKSVLQVQDKDKGLIIGKGLYSKTHIGFSLVSYIFDTWHILRVDIKKNKVRIILSLTYYDFTVSGGSSPDTNSKILIANSFPVNPKGRLKNQFAKAFYGSHLRAQKTLLAIEKAIKKGNTFNVKKDDW